MRKHLKYFSIIVTATLLYSCSGSGLDAAKFLAERDSIKYVTERQQKELNELDSVMSIVAFSLDSIAQTEAYLYYSQEGRKLSRRDVLNNLEFFKKLINRQRKLISSLQDSLLNKSGNTEKFTRIISYLNAELAQKDQEIQTLKSELTSNRVKIAELQSNVATLQHDMATLDAQNKAQEQALAVQDEIINEGYVKIATKKELQHAGLLSGGLFTKKELDYSRLQKSDFMKVDIRNFNELIIDSKSIKILTAMPKESYQTVKSEGKTLLRIIDPTTFWSISLFLVIQIN